MTVQLPLGIGLPDSSVFATYYRGANAPACAAVEATALGHGDTVSYLYGTRGTGRTHLLQAACAAATNRGRRAALLPLARAAELAPQMIEGWERFDLVCLDDIGGIAGDPDWELALFELFNALRAAGGCWIASGDDAPLAIGIALPDLASRLAAGPTYRLAELDDAGRMAALGLRARQRGLELPEEVGRFLLKHLPRDMSTLHGALARLDEASMARQRRLTIPLAREVLGI